MSSFYCFTQLFSSTDLLDQQLMVELPFTYTVHAVQTHPGTSMENADRRLVGQRGEAARAISMKSWGWVNIIFLCALDLVPLH